MVTRTVIRCVVLATPLAVSDVQVQEPSTTKAANSGGDAELNERVGRGRDRGCFLSSQPVSDSLGPKNRALGIMVGDPACPSPLQGEDEVRPL